MEIYYVEHGKLRYKNKNPMAFLTVCYKVKMLRKASIALEKSFQIIYGNIHLKSWDSLLIQLTKCLCVSNSVLLVRKKSANFPKIASNQKQMKTRFPY